jgi:hypothetical protein
MEESCVRSRVTVIVPANYNWYSVQYDHVTTLLSQPHHCSKSKWHLIV